MQFPYLSYYVMGKETKQNAIEEDRRLDNEEQKNNTVKREHLEEHISREENDDKLQVILGNDENNIQDAHQSFAES
ncbi:MAG: hypothetical protein WAM42_23765 [Candidatus Nitrosopolaris sp.]|jgi:hypothetical protein